MPAYKKFLFVMLLLLLCFVLLLLCIITGQRAEQRGYQRRLHADVPGPDQAVCLLQ